MKPMRPFLVTLVLVWTAASIAAFVYSQQQNLSRALLFALLPAFLIEIGLYLMPGFERVRRQFDRIGSKYARALLLLCGALAPYLVESSATHTFAFTPFLLLTTLAAAAAFWYAAFRPGPLADLLFLAFMGGVYVSKVFGQIYIRPTPHLQIEILGKLMWIRLGAMALLSLRRIENVRFGFLPSSAEWRIGIEQFLYFLPVGGAAVYFLRFANFHPLPLVWWKFALFVPAVFCGIMWSVALGEELFFRGFLQQLAARGLHNRTAGLVIASAVFGIAHLPYRLFPNWRLAVIAAIAGLFYGIAFLRSRSIRASMVTHALVVTAWKSLLV